MIRWETKGRYLYRPIHVAWWRRALRWLAR
jgi:hypothetical protein